VKRSVAELVYHAKVLDALRLDTTAKIQIHVGGMYGDKDRAIERFVSEYRRLPRTVSRRLVIENDDRLYSLADCMAVHTKTGIPVLFDTFHHSVLNQGEGLHEALRMARSTWKRKDGVVMVDYSSQATGKRAGKHIEHINIRDLKRFAKGLQTDCDIMLEIKDKERSAAKALNALKELGKL
jgi:UV DNA damage endonuclease